ncbi:MAG: PTS sugar transporter subunit IIA [Pseudomonadales bacterium]|jgi:PTS system nitrogen regulatory IIA component|nr:PTS sugar transporter subunit IIA [Pseudomonadales bacterium]
MNIESILAPDRVFSGVEASSKKRAIEHAALKIGETLPELDVGDLYRGLIDREKIGSTGLGDGVAIPHCRLSSCTNIVGSLFVFDEGVDFSSPDDQPVHIMFVLLVPEAETSEHLSTLSMLAERLQLEKYRNDLVNAEDDETLFQRAIQSLEEARVQSSGGQ